MACDKNVLDGKDSRFSTIDWKSFKLTRISRSSLHAEGQAAAAGVDALAFVKLFWSALRWQDADVTNEETAKRAG